MSRTPVLRSHRACAAEAGARCGSTVGEVVSRLGRQAPFLALAVATLVLVVCCRSPVRAAAVGYEKLALLIGIDEYRHMADLDGAVNDVENLKDLLVEQFGFPDGADHIRVLENSNATRDAILRAMKEHLIDKATSESIVVFHYSGHGSQARDASNEETDGWDETLVTHDSGRKPHPNRDITDDEISAFLARLTEITPHVTVIFDSCHSGTATRGTGLARTAPRDDRPLPPRPELPFAPRVRGAVQDASSGLRPAGASWVLISGSRSDELANELQIGERSFGALSWHLANEIRKAGGGATYRDLMDRVRVAVEATHRSQHPQLEGPGGDQLVFGTASAPRPPYVVVKDGGSDDVTLGTGAVHGVTRGSRYDVYPPDATDFDARPSARVEVRDVRATLTTATIVEGGPVAAASRAVERDHHYPKPVLRAHFLDAESSATLREIRAQVAAIEHLEVEPTGRGYDVLVRERDEPDAVAGQGANRRSIAIEGGDSIEISPSVPIGEPDTVARVLKQLESWAKWFNLSRIENAAPTLEIEVELEAVAPGDDDSASSDPSAVLTALEGERFAVAVTNRSERPLYLAVLNLSSDGSVHLIYPATGEEELVAPGKTWRQVLETFVPNGRDSVRDILKVFATSTPADFRFLDQPAVRGGTPLTRGGEPLNPLEQLLAAAALGTTRGIQVVEVGHWTTADAVLEVRRPE